MKAIEFFVEGEPKGQPRPRAFVRAGKARVYDPGSAEGWKSCIAVAAKQHRPETPLTDAVSLHLRFYMKRPKSHFGTGRKSHLLKHGSPSFHTGKPDLDNAMKAVADALTMLGFWKDDSQIASVTLTKMYSQRPGCQVTIMEICE